MKNNVQEHRLATMLDLAVPIHIERLRPLGMDYIHERANEINQLEDSTGQRLVGSDALIHTRSPDTANAFNALAEATACMAFYPGGVELFGRHWDATKQFGMGRPIGEAT